MNMSQIRKRQRVTPTGLISIKTLNLQIVEDLLNSADHFKDVVNKDGGCDILKHRVLASLFFEPSTRTSCSFTAAMLRLGGTVMNVDEQKSSTKKGETLTDTIQTMNAYCDAIILRHPEKGSASRALNVSNIPIINAGDGTGEHPSQALLDLYTIKKELGHIGYDDNVNNDISKQKMMAIVILGDLKHGRTVHSLVQLLANFSGIGFIFVSPNGLNMPDTIIEDITKKGAKVAFASSLNDHVSFNNNNGDSNADVLGQADVLYVTRIQKERFATENEYIKVKGSYIVDKELMKNAKPAGKMVVMHPLPRVDEINTDVDNDPRAAYFRQMENGMYMRMAILHWLILDKVVPDAIKA